MNIQNIRKSKEVLEHLLGYSVQYIPVGNNVFNSNPSEKLETTYNNFNNLIQDLTPDIFYKTISNVIGRVVDENTFVDGFVLGITNYDLKAKTQNTIQAMNTQLFMDSL